MNVRNIRTSTGLLRALKEAKYGDRHLDSLIHMTTGQLPEKVYIPNVDKECKVKKWWLSDLCPGYFCVDTKEGMFMEAVCTPQYTREIESAASLLPGWSWTIGSANGRYAAQIGNLNELGKGEGATPALALCIAAMDALKTRT